jgi:dihydrofolate reductase
MGRVIYTAAMSLDGFIAGPGGDMSWLMPHMGPDPEIDEVQQGLGALLVGNRTYGGDDPNRGTDAEGAFDGTWDGPVVVVTHRPPTDPVPGVEFAGSIADGLAVARTAAGDKDVAVLGADIARQLVEAGALDEVLVTIVPVLLGGGTRLFDRSDGQPVQLERTRVVTVPHAVNMWFRVLR